MVGISVHVSGATWYLIALPRLASGKNSGFASLPRSPHPRGLLFGSPSEIEIQIAESAGLVRGCLYSIYRMFFAGSMAETGKGPSKQACYTSVPVVC